MGKALAFDDDKIKMSTRGETQNSVNVYFMNDPIGQFIFCNPIPARRSHCAILER